MGPQLGYYYPEIVLEADLHGPGIKAQGALVPGGGPYVLIGRTKDYAWSLTSASNDNRDQFLEQLCEPDGSEPTRDSRHYVYKGQCRAMTTFDAGTLDGDPRRYPITVHGPVSGTATVAGKPYAITRLRSTFGEDALSLGALRDMTVGRGKTVKGFFESANQFGFTFNWGYASRDTTAYFSSGKLPRRAPRTNKLLPTLGTGDYDWRGFLSLRRAPARRGRARTGSSSTGTTSPRPGWQTGDDGHIYGSVHRVDMFDDFPRRARIADVASIMNRAATEDLRATELWPVIRRVLAGSPAPDALTAQAADILTSVVERRRQQARRRPRRQDRRPRRRDHRPRLDQRRERRAEPGARAAHGRPRRAQWPQQRHVRRRLVRLRGQGPPDAAPQPGTRPVQAALLRERLVHRVPSLAVGRGSRQRRTSSPPPRARIPRSGARTRRRSGSRFAPGLLSDTMRFTNRPTFQQVLRFGR